MRLEIRAISFLRVSQKLLIEDTNMAAGYMEY